MSDTTGEPEAEKTENSPKKPLDDSVTIASNDAQVPPLDDSSGDYIHRG